LGDYKENKLDFSLDLLESRNKSLLGIKTEKYEEEMEKSILSIDVLNKNFKNYGKKVSEVVD
jgi:hypothetical protein